jgi:hypothetical protein
MSANNLHIGIARSAVNPLCEIFHLPDRVAGKTYGPHVGRSDVLAPRSGYEASATIISSWELRSVIIAIAFS